MAPHSSRNAKVFCIGFHRTGTTNLARFLSDLGFATLHWPSEYEGADYEELAASLGNDRAAVVRLLGPMLRRYDAFGDVPFPGLYRELATGYPGSRFILTRRHLDPWWESVVRHKQLKDRGEQILSPFEQIQYTDPAGKSLERISVELERVFKNRHRDHWNEVSEFFSGMPERLLVLDLEDPRKATMIAEYLGLTTNRDFPHT